MRLVTMFALLVFSVLHAASAEDVPPPAEPGVRHYLKIPDGRLADFFKRPPIAVPMVSHHRGGPMPGFPENSLEAMDNALAYGYGLMEVDVAQLSDGTLILMHDDTLGRTTNGTGALRQKTWRDVSELVLKDETGALTSFRIPKLEDVLRWAIGRTVLTLDIKRGVDFAKVVSLVNATGSQDYVAAIAYTIEQAKTFNRLAPGMPLSVGLTSEADIEAFDESGIPAHLAIAWTGTRLLEAEFYQRLQQRGWRVIVGTLGRRDTALDSRIRDGRSGFTYIDVVRRGADIIATDRFWAVQMEIANPNLLVYTQQKLAK